MAEDQAKAFIDQATQSLQGGQIAQALELAEQAVEADPTSGEAHLLKAIALSQSSQPQAATEEFQKSIELQPGVAKSYFNFAVHLYSQGQKEQALNYAQLAVDSDPTHASARDLANRIEAETGLKADFPSNPTPSSVAEQASPQAQYPRTGYEEQPVHTIPFVQNFGKAWVGIAWGIAACQFGMFVFQMIRAVTYLPKIFQTANDPQAMQNWVNQMNAGPILTVVGLLLTLGATTWTIMDIADLRGKWVWLVPQLLLTCCCGLGFVILPIYILAGRRTT